MQGILHGKKPSNYWPWTAQLVRPCPCRKQIAKEKVKENQQKPSPDAAPAQFHTPSRSPVELVLAEKSSRYWETRTMNISESYFMISSLAALLLPPLINHPGRHLRHCKKQLHYYERTRGMKWKVCHAKRELGESWVQCGIREEPRRELMDLSSVRSCIVLSENDRRPRMCPWWVDCESSMTITLPSRKMLRYYYLQVPFENPGSWNDRRLRTRKR